MPTMTLTVDHDKSQEEATKRIQGLLDKMQGQYSGMLKDVEVDWSGTRAELRGKAPVGSTSGTLEVGPDDVQVTLELPFLAGTFQGQIESYIRNAIESELAD